MTVLPRSAGGFTVPGVGGLVRDPRMPRPDTADTAWQARVSREAPRVPWDVFTREHLNWKQGEHMGLIGPTGQGKTTLLMWLLPLQPYVVVFATKPSDATMDRLITGGYLLIERWENIPVDRAPRRVLWPNASELEADENQKAVFHDAFVRIFREKGWCVVLDEGYVIGQELGLTKDIRRYLTQARSLGISLVVATQRPAWVPVELYDQSTHLFFWRDNDERNLSRISGISWRSADLIRGLVANLEEFQVLYINTRTGRMARTRVPGPSIPLTNEGR